MDHLYRRWLSLILIAACGGTEVHQTADATQDSPVEAGPTPTAVESADTDIPWPGDGPDVLLCELAAHPNWGDCPDCITGDSRCVFGELEAVRVGDCVHCKAETRLIRALCATDYTGTRREFEAERVCTYLHEE